MLKYGSFRLFLIKFSLGVTIIVISSIYLISLLTYSLDDPGFATYENSASNQNLNNYFGHFGAHLSSYSMVIIGHLSYIIGVFSFLEGTKLTIGIQNKLRFLRVISLLLSIFFINIFFEKYLSSYVEPGLISAFITGQLESFLQIYLNNYFILFMIYLFLLLIGFFLLIFAFSIKLKIFTNFLIFFKIFKILKYLNLFSVLSFKFKRSEKKVYVSKKNEPTIQKRADVFTYKQKEVNVENYKQAELDQFKFTLPKNILLYKSVLKNNFNKELKKINSDASLRLEKTLSEYGVDGKVIGFKTGPIVTLFEFIPNAGIKTSKVVGLSDDIARAMSSISARIAVQPGKTSLGIEIPNQKRDDVYFGDLIEDDEFKSDKESLTLALGKDISGEKIFADLEKMPHLLIAGTTGSGKSVGINTMILSLLFKFKPNECKLILIDPKMLELSVYEDIPHLLTPVVTDPKKAVFALKWVVREMENRYKLMSSVNVKNISSYNDKVVRTISSGRKLFREVQTGIDSETKMPIIEKKEIILEKMPFIVVVIDEMADLMMVAGKEVEQLVQRLAQMARASGIHLITATQRPSVDVITGTIKANFPSRISYKVASKFDSRTILNEMGAEQLLGSGDMLLLENGGNVKRLHGGYVSENEVDKVVSFIKKQSMFDNKNEISLKESGINKEIGDDLVSDNNDELYGKAVEIVIKQQKVSTSYIQRYLQIGYNRAARIVEKMEEDGIISEPNNAGKRHVLKK
tara:strand:- start:37160 stop:39394 length:2235 start_codon:yes stop_codon:yes gene_type:complete